MPQPPACGRHTRKTAGAVRQLQPLLTPYHCFGFPLASKSARPKGTASKKTLIVVGSRDEEVAQRASAGAARRYNKKKVPPGVGRRD
jgi:hypothetical protein